MSRITDDERALIDQHLEEHGVTRKPKRKEREQAPAQWPDRIATPRAASKRLPRRNTRLRAKPEMTVQEALEWAFAVEHVQLELPEREVAEDRGQGFGMEYVMIQRAALGVTIDTSIGCSEPHEDAEAIAAIVSNLPDHMGGRWMAIKVSEYARARTTPDWMPDAVPRFEPVEWKLSKTGWKGKTQLVEVIEWVDIHRKRRTFDSYMTPVHLTPMPSQIDSARNLYTDWRMAVGYIRRALQTSSVLRCVQVRDHMPAMMPWLVRSS